LGLEGTRCELLLLLCGALPVARVLKVVMGTKEPLPSCMPPSRIVSISFQLKDVLHKQEEATNNMSAKAGLTLCNACIQVCCTGTDIQEVATSHRHTKMKQGRMQLCDIFLPGAA
jgi:hypothetical protein